MDGSGLPLPNLPEMMISSKNGARLRHAVELLLLQGRAAVGQQQQLNGSVKFLEHLKRFFVNMRTGAALFGEPLRQFLAELVVIDADGQQPAPPGLLAVYRGKLLQPGGTPAALRPKT